ncbi:purine nucleoside permease [Striga asiatica]|uniref:Purine nucleoside permease n=1 Tax=Striga asiatica TaxID=4170 RepID=A0A5A7PZV8_STRAF|nr:purine nucleoside permease [Striga asiatica]
MAPNPKKGSEDSSRFSFCMNLLSAEALHFASQRILRAHLAWPENYYLISLLCTNIEGKCMKYGRKIYAGLEMLHTLGINDTPRAFIDGMPQNATEVAPSEDSLVHICTPPILLFRHLVEPKSSELKVRRRSSDSERKHWVDVYSDPERKLRQLLKIAPPSFVTVFPTRFPRTEVRLVSSQNCLPVRLGCSPFIAFGLNIRDWTLSCFRDSGRNYYPSLSAPYAFVTLGLLRLTPDPIFWCTSKIRLMSSVSTRSVT